MDAIYLPLGLGMIAGQILGDADGWIECDASPGLQRVLGTLVSAEFGAL